MSVQLVDYTSYKKLDCVGCLPAPVILCVPDGLVAPKDICPGSTNDNYPYNYVEAEIVSFLRLQNQNQGTFYRYTIAYEDAQLLSGNLLETSDVEGIFCKGCLTTWVEDIVGNEPSLVDNGDDTLTWTSPHGCTLTFTVGGGGTVTCEDVLNCINIVPTTLEGDGSLGDPFTVKISSTAGNNLVTDANGLYVGSPVFAAANVCPDAYFTGAPV